MKYFLLFILLFYVPVFAEDEDFDLEDGAPKKETPKVEVNEKALTDLLRTGKYSQLKEIFDKLKNSNDKKLEESSIRKVLISYSIETGAYKEAAENIDKKQLGEDEDSYFLASEVYRLIGEFDKANKQIKAGLEKFPKSAPLLYADSNLSKLRGDILQ